jgi:hypothetical protein
MPDNRLNKVRIGFAPFSSSINAGPYAATVTNNSSPDNCVFERVGGNATTDATVGAGDYLQSHADVGVGQGYCTVNGTNEIVPLSEDKDMLKAATDGFRGATSTAGQLGTAWAWYLVSPNWSNVWPGASSPVSYGTKDVIKAVVLMTDGKYNTVGGRSGRDGQSRQQARDLCRNMKAEGVVVYSVLFMENDPDAVAVMTECASADGGGQKYFYRAEDGAALGAAFRDIAFKLNNLRIVE